MDLVSSCRAMERRKPSPSTPVKAFSPGAAAAAAATKSSIPEEIVTPEKLAELPRRIRNRGVAFSMKEVRKIAASLRQPHGVSPDRTKKSRPRFAEKDTALGPIFDNVQMRLPLKPLPKLTETRFSYGHLAQLKYILPEAMCIKKILRHLWRVFL
ncbi:unnamed protein product [Spirodela intermedia]|uniref:Uncharacterized protein n=1 Tax=Spirodela intermedia TaxID=51605 RepID=A0ABN7EC63_SPIIN|nr:unnamed protein product [Spirodela intermedia]